MNIMTTADNRSTKPWFREPWPWLLMAGPLIVIVAGFVTAWLAISSSDGLVADDYYKQGLAAAETLARSQKAKEQGLSVSLSLNSDAVRIHLNAREATFVPPAILKMTLSHPTRAGIDQKTTLKQEGDRYVGEINLPASGHWLVLVEDDASTWRVMGTVMLPALGETVIGEAGMNAATSR